MAYPNVAPDLIDDRGLGCSLQRRCHGVRGAGAIADVFEQVLARGGRKTSPRGSFVEPCDSTPTYSEVGLNEKTAMVAKRRPKTTDASRICLLALCQK
jgi:hypothetical protein